MGLLDDAIREHLDLKRKHGANPEEVAKQEREALGPARRGEFAQPAGDEPAAPAAPAPAPEEPAGVADPTAAPAEQPTPAAEQAPAAPPPEGAADPPTTAAPGYEEDPWLVEETADTPPERREEDVLEETPEFLQETPEHERLWFEQKPPRDFDWDR
jgi:hypothetical protein